MPTMPMLAIETPRIARQQRLHNARRRNFCHLHQQVKVVGHQDISVKGKRVALPHYSHTFQKGLIVRCPKEDPLAVVTASHEMIRETRGVNARMTRRAPRIVVMQITQV